MDAKPVKQTSDGRLAAASLQPTLFATHENNLCRTARHGVGLIEAWPEPSCKQLSWWEPRSPTTPRVEGSGRTVLACPTPSRKCRQPRRHLSRPRPASLVHGRLRWLHRLPLAAWWHATVSTVPRFQGHGRPPGQASGGMTMTKASVSFAGNLTDDPEVRYTESGVARAISGWPSAVGGSRRCRSSP
jgi:hypothetical protein